MHGTELTAPQTDARPAAVTEEAWQPRGERRGACPLLVNGGAAPAGAAQAARPWGPAGWGLPQRAVGRPGRRGVWGGPGPHLLLLAR